LEKYRSTYDWKTAGTGIRRKGRQEKMWFDASVEVRFILGCLLRGVTSYQEVCELADRIACASFLDEVCAITHGGNEVWKGLWGFGLSDRDLLRERLVLSEETFNALLRVIKALNREDLKMTREVVNALFGFRLAPFADVFVALKRRGDGVMSG